MKRIAITLAVAAILTWVLSAVSADPAHPLTLEAYFAGFMFFSVICSGFAVICSLGDAE